MDENIFNNDVEETSETGISELEVPETEVLKTEVSEIETPKVELKKTDLSETKANKVEEPIREAKRMKVKGFGSCKFVLSIMMMFLTVISGATLMIDMFIVNYEQSMVNTQSYVEYIKGTDIFNWINYFGSFSPDEKTFTITAIVCMIVTIGIGIVQLFLIMLWRNKRGYVVVMFTSVMAIVSEAIMICVFLEKYVNSQYDAIGMVGYGPIIAIVSHVFIIMLASVTRKLTKINIIVNP